MTYVLKAGKGGEVAGGETRFHEGGNLMITSKTRETRHSGALSRVQDNKPASPHIGCCLTPKCPQINSNGNLPRPSSLGVTAISTGGGDIKIGFPPRN